MKTQYEPLECNEVKITFEMPWGETITGTGYLKSILQGEDLGFRQRQCGVIERRSIAFNGVLPLDEKSSWTVKIPDEQACKVAAMVDEFKASVSKLTGLAETITGSLPRSHITGELRPTS